MLFVICFCSYSFIILIFNDQFVLFILIAGHIATVSVYQMHRCQSSDNMYGNTVVCWQLARSLPSLQYARIRYWNWSEPPQNSWICITYIDNYSGFRFSYGSLFAHGIGGGTVVAETNTSIMAKIVVNNTKSFIVFCVRV